jgi:glycosyltransferase involved in cell wall biosynthesis
MVGRAMTKPPPCVSIVIPCFNQGSYLADAIESACRQSHSNVEVIVVDDGSTDDTPRIAAACRTIRYLHQPNSGTAAARNHGLRESRGAFVIFLDADDRLLPGAAARGVEYLTRRPDAGFVTGHVQLIRSDGRPHVVPAQDHDSAGYLALLRWNYIWSPGAVLYRRSTLERVGGFDPSAGGSADYALNIRIARQFPIACHHQIVLEYRQHGANMSRDPAHMLRSAVSVRRREKVYARRSDNTRKAWLDGIRAAQADFGARLIDRIKGDLINGRRWRAMRGLAWLLRYYPSGLAAMAAPREWPKIVARRWRTVAR